MNEETNPQKKDKKITIASLFGAWQKGSTGSTEVEEMRYGKEEKARENSLRKL